MSSHTAVVQHVVVHSQSTPVSPQIRLRSWCCNEKHFVHSQSTPVSPQTGLRPCILEGFFDVKHDETRRNKTSKKG